MDFEISKRIEIENLIRNDDKWNSPQILIDYFFYAEEHGSRQFCDTMYFDMRSHFDVTNIQVILGTHMLSRIGQLTDI